MNDPSIKTETRYRVEVHARSCGWLKFGSFDQLDDARELRQSLKTRTYPLNPSRIVEVRTTVAVSTLVIEEEQGGSSC